MQGSRKGANRGLEGQDPLLHPFLRATDEVALVELETLLENEATPIVHRILARRLGLTAVQSDASSVDLRSLDAEDLSQQTLMALTARLWHVYAAPETHRISSFRSYVAGAAFNTWRAAVRNDAKLWAQLSGRLTYLCRSSAGHVGFAKWQDTEHESMAGFTVWRKKKTPIGHFDQPDEDLPEDQPHPNTPLPDIAAWVLRRAGGPLPWNDFVTAVACILELKDQRISIDRELPADLLPSEGTEDSADRSLKRDQLRVLWNELLRLDQKERAALLLKTEDLLDLEITEVATLPVIANVVGIPLSQLTSLLPRLPLEDQEIAQLLGIRRQTVVNLRSQARSSLRRRLRAQKD